MLTDQTICILVIRSEECNPSGSVNKKGMPAAEIIST